MEYWGPSGGRRPVKRLPDRKELGHPVPISLVLGRNEVAAVGVTGIVAYRTGFAFTLVIAFRDSSSRLSPLGAMNRTKLAQLQRGDPPSAEEVFQVSLAFSDGSSITTSGGLNYEEEPGRTLDLMAGQGGGDTAIVTWYTSPLPPPGPIVFSVDWPVAKMAFRNEVDLRDEFEQAAKMSKYLLDET